mmetsp:Transcript_3565/g.7757  ORF Transcript_3565/g.7757 Transcript_3565/m.7757 type:complete len:89 (+) Transcript_3565:658-924(+)
MDVCGVWQVTSNSGRVGLWDLYTGLCCREMFQEEDVYPVALLANGRQVIVGYAEGMVRVWDTCTGHSRALLHTHKGAVRFLGIRLPGK